MHAVVAVLLVAALGACSSTGSGSLGPAESFSGAVEPPDSGSGITACDEVAAGIDAFNRSDLDETIASFERALPLAEAEDAAAGTRASADLLEAVEYYAALPAEDYLAASASSPDFARYQAITLGQCVADGPPRDGSNGGDGGGVLA